VSQRLREHDCPWDEDIEQNQWNEDSAHSPWEEDLGHNPWEEDIEEDLSTDCCALAALGGHLEG